MAIEQIDGAAALKKLEPIIRAAERVCVDRNDMVAAFVGAIGTVAVNSPCCGDAMLEAAIHSLTEARASLPASAIRSGALAGKAGAS
jgi:hypothetical protein